MSTTPFQAEAWTEYGIGVIILLLRLYARWKVVGFKWQGDDWFTVVALVFWTIELCMLELIGQYGTNIGLNDITAGELSSEQIERFEFGSKCLLAGWVCYVTLIWCLKGSMLFFYHRITLGLAQQKAVKVTAVICLMAYIATIAVIFGHCTPVWKLWQIYPFPGDRCSASTENYLALVVTNLVTDSMIICIPMPLLWVVKIPLRRKLLIGVLLCSGIFIMIATILRCVLSLRDINGINTSTIWAIRETFVGIIAVNAACIKPLISRSRWLRTSEHSSSRGAKFYGDGSSAHPLSNLKSSQHQHQHHSNAHTRAADTLAENSSEEMIVKDFDGNFKNNVVIDGGGSGLSFAEGIRVTTTYEVKPSQFGGGV